MAELGLSGQLLDWYRRHGRDLPWRARPGETPDPYAVWLAEIMLQQTTVAAVRGYYRRFLAQWRDVEALAAAPRDEVLQAWAGLGYYARARNLHACAKAVVAAGGFPRTAAGLQALPGIGPYTAGAIAAIAFGERAAAVDGNVERVIARLHAIETPLPASKPEIRARTLALVPHAAPGDFAQALMDLGATVCTPRSPDCPSCPWRAACRARALGIATALPRKAARKPQPVRHGIAFWIERPDGAVLLRRRPEKGLLGGMMEIPSTAWGTTLPARPLSEAPLAAAFAPTALTVTHTFTHFHLVLGIWRAVAAANVPPPPDCHWAPLADLGGQALPSVMRKIVAACAKEDAKLRSGKPRA